MTKRRTTALWDAGLLAFLLAAAALLWLGFSANREPGARVSVTVDGVEVGRYDLSEDLDLWIEAGGGRNRLIVKDGVAYVAEADCPNGLCVKSGGVSRAGETVVCLPHGLVITVIGGEAGEVDLLS